MAMLPSANLTHFASMSSKSRAGFNRYSISTGCHDFSPGIPEIAGNLLKQSPRLFEPAADRLHIENHLRAPAAGFVLTLRNSLRS